MNIFRSKATESFVLDGSMPVVAVYSPYGDLIKTSESSSEETGAEVEVETEETTDGVDLRFESKRNIALYVNALLQQGNVVVTSTDCYDVITSSIYSLCGDPLNNVEPAKGYLIVFGTEQSFSHIALNSILQSTPHIIRVVTDYRGKDFPTEVEVKEYLEHTKGLRATNKEIRERNKAKKEDEIKEDLIDVPLYFRGKDLSSRIHWYHILEMVNTLYYFTEKGLTYNTSLKGQILNMAIHKGTTMFVAEGMNPPVELKRVIDTKKLSNFNNINYWKDFKGVNYDTTEIDNALTGKKVKANSTFVNFFTPITDDIIKLFMVDNFVNVTGNTAPVSKDAIVLRTNTLTMDFGINFESNTPTELSGYINTLLSLVTNKLEAGADIIIPIDGNCGVSGLRACVYAYLNNPNLTGKVVVLADDTYYYTNSSVETTQLRAFINYLQSINKLQLVTYNRLVKTIPVQNDKGETVQRKFDSSYLNAYIVEQIGYPCYNCYGTGEYFSNLKNIIYDKDILNRLTSYSYNAQISGFKQVTVNKGKASWYMGIPEAVGGCEDIINALMSKCKKKSTTAVKGF